ncbi:MAG: hypothetical protein D6732_21085 [Methanobacteriota archaeon]|nr:MAG: hypothetical protein D6732_21085 [Euryarchaeota archaeon]
MQIDEQLNAILEPILEELNLYDNNRETIIQLTRQLNRDAGKGIAAIVKGNDPQRYLDSTRTTYAKLHPIMETTASVLSWNVAASGVEEYAELEILNAIVQQQHIPDPRALKIPSWIWITGLADVVGELRRIVLRNLLTKNIPQAQIHLEQMNAIYDAIIGLEFGKQIANSLRKKVDTARYLLERTESDMLMASLGWKISEHNSEGE